MYRENLEVNEVTDICQLIGISIAKLLVMEVRFCSHVFEYVNVFSPYTLKLEYHPNPLMYSNVHTLELEEFIES